MFPIFSFFFFFSFFSVVVYSASLKCNNKHSFSKLQLVLSYKYFYIYPVETVARATCKWNFHVIRRALFPSLREIVESLLLNLMSLYFVLDVWRWLYMLQNLLFYYENESCSRPSGVVLLEGCYCDRLITAKGKEPDKQVSVYRF